MARSHGATARKTALEEWSYDETESVVGMRTRRRQLNRGGSELPRALRALALVRPAAVVGPCKRRFRLPPLRPGTGRAPADTARDWRTAGSEGYTPPVTSANRTRSPVSAERAMATSARIAAAPSSTVAPC